MTEPPVLDEVNKKIIEQLQQDGRMSYAALAKIVGLSEAAVHQRCSACSIRARCDRALTDPLNLGFTAKPWLACGSRATCG